MTPAEDLRANRARERAARMKLAATEHAAWLAYRPGPGAREAYDKTVEAARNTYIYEVTQ